MSLVNDMLRDLNRRNSVSGQAARVNGAFRSPVDRRRPDSRLGVALILAVVAALAGAYFYSKSRSQPAVPVVQTAAPVAAAQPVSATPQAVATPVPVAPVLNIHEEFSSGLGFLLRIQATRPVEYAITDRGADELVLHLDGIKQFSRGNLSFGGISVLPVGNGIDIEFELDYPTDFLVYEDAQTAEFDLLIEATYRKAETAAAGSQTQVTAAAAPSMLATGSAGILPQELLPLDSLPVPVVVPAVPVQARLSQGGADDATAPTRVNRELSLVEQDRNTSQRAVAMLQAGRLFEAYELLLAFISQHGAAHQSRETLATLLFAQQDYAQADAIVDEGLALVPNYSAYKKIKARLLMQQGDIARAALLLGNLPPVVTDDAEYHELLASLYQQSNQHNQAVSTYQELLRTDSKQGRWWTGLGISLEAQGKRGDALASYQAALQTADLEAPLRQYGQNRIRNLSAPQ